MSIPVSDNVQQMFNRLLYITQDPELRNRLIRLEKGLKANTKMSDDEKKQFLLKLNDDIVRGKDFTPEQVRSHLDEYEKAVAAASKPIPASEIGKASNDDNEGTDFTVLPVLDKDPKINDWLINEYFGRTYDPNHVEDPAVDKYIDQLSEKNPGIAIDLITAAYALEQMKAAEEKRDPREAVKKDWDHSLDRWVAPYQGKVDKDNGTSANHWANVRNNYDLDLLKLGVGKSKSNTEDNFTEAEILLNRKYDEEIRKAIAQGRSGDVPWLEKQRSRELNEAARNRDIINDFTDADLAWQAAKSEAEESNVNKGKFNEWAKSLFDKDWTNNPNYFRFANNLVTPDAYQGYFHGDTLTRGAKHVISKVAKYTAYEELPEELQQYVDPPEQPNDDDVSFVNDLVEQVGESLIDDNLEGVSRQMANFYNTYMSTLNLAGTKYAKDAQGFAWGNRADALRDYNENIKKPTRQLESLRNIALGGKPQQIDVIELEDDKRNKTGQFFYRSTGKVGNNMATGNYIASKDPETGVWTQRNALNRLSTTENELAIRAKYKDLAKVVGWKGKLDDFPPYLNAKWMINDTQDPVARSNKFEDMYSALVGRLKKANSNMGSREYHQKLLQDQNKWNVNRFLDKTSEEALKMGIPNEEALKRFLNKSGLKIDPDSKKIRALTDEELEERKKIEEDRIKREKEAQQDKFLSQIGVRESFLKDIADTKGRIEEEPDVFAKYRLQRQLGNLVKRLNTHEENWEIVQDPDTGKWQVTQKLSPQKTPESLAQSRYLGTGKYFKGGVLPPAIRGAMAKFRLNENDYGFVVPPDSQDKDLLTKKAEYSKGMVAAINEAMRSLKKEYRTQKQLYKKALKKGDEADAANLIRELNENQGSVLTEYLKARDSYDDDYKSALYKLYALDKGFEKEKKARDRQINNDIKNSLASDFAARMQEEDYAGDGYDGGGSITIGGTRFVLKYSPALQELKKKIDAINQAERDEKNHTITERRFGKTFTVNGKKQRATTQAVPIMERTDAGDTVQPPEGHSSAYYTVDDHEARKLHKEKVANKAKIKTETVQPDKVNVSRFANTALPSNGNKLTGQPSAEDLSLNMGELNRNMNNIGVSDDDIG